MSIAVHGPDGVLAAQFRSALEGVQLDIVKANEILSSADALSLPPKSCLSPAKHALTQADSLVSDLLTGCEFAPQIKAQKLFATTSNVISWDSCVRHATVEQLCYLRAGAQVGGRSMIEPSVETDAVRVNANGLTVSSYTFVVQAMLGVATIGIPVVAACAVCSRNVISDAPRSDHNSLLIHAGSHSEMLNSHIHKPVVSELMRFFKLHGYATCQGDYGGDHRHSADLTVLHYYDVGKHLRIDVKTCVDFNRSNGPRGFDVHLGLMETRCTYEHRGSSVKCFAITASGGLGPQAIALLASL